MLGKAVLVVILIFQFQYSYSENKMDIYEKIQEYTKDIEKDPESSIDYELRGHCYKKLKKYDLALKDYEIANRLYENITVYNGIAEINLKRNNPNEALKIISKGLKLDSSYELSYAIRGICYDFLDKPASAISDYTQFLDQYPNKGIPYHQREIWSILYVRRAILNFGEKKHEAALNDINIAIMIDGKGTDKNSDLYYIRHNIYYASGRKKEAMADLNIAFQKGFSNEKKIQLLKSSHSVEEQKEIESLIKKYNIKTVDNEFKYENREFIIETFFKINDF